MSTLLRFSELSATKQTKAINLFCRARGYEDEILDLDEDGKFQKNEDGTTKTKSNPEAKADFVQRLADEYIVTTARKQNLRDKRDIADEDAKNDF